MRVENTEVNTIIFGIFAFFDSKFWENPEKKENLKNHNFENKMSFGLLEFKIGLQDW